MGMSGNSSDYLALYLLFYNKGYQKLVFYWMDLQHTVSAIFHLPPNNSKPVLWGFFFFGINFRGFKLGG